MPYFCYTYSTDTKFSSLSLEKIQFSRKFLQILDYKPKFCDDENGFSFNKLIMTPNYINYFKMKQNAHFQICLNGINASAVLDKSLYFLVKSDGSILQKTGRYWSEQWNSKGIIY